MVESGRLESGYLINLGSGVRIPLSPPLLICESLIVRVVFMFTLQRLFLIFFSLLSINSILAQIYDNRFMPLFNKPFSRTQEKGSNVMADPFLMTANDAVLNSDTTTGIPEIFGKYDQMQVANALVSLGKPNLLLPTFALLVAQDKPILWTMHGKIQAQGVSFAYNQRFFQHCQYNSHSYEASFGFSWFFMHLFSRINFFMTPEQQNSIGLSNDDVLLLDQIRREMNDESGICAPKSSQAGMSDIDCYLRWGGLWDYSLKCKHIDAGVRFGLMVNTGVTRDVNNPASIPFGGDGFLGLYCAQDIEVEIKEDWKIGWLARFSTRIGKHRFERISLDHEQPLFGVTAGNVYIEPGPTFVFAPYFSLEDIRDGLGVQVNYTLAWHLDDLWQDARAVKNPPSTLEQINKVTKWVAEYLTVNLYYDFSKVRGRLSDAPEFWFMWDIPIKLAAAKRVSKTNRISCGMIFSF